MMLVQELSRRTTVADLSDINPLTPALVRVQFRRVPDQPRGGPVAWWLDDEPPPLSPADSRRPVIAVSDRPLLVDAARASGLPARIVPVGEVEPESAPVPPFVRERIRRVRGLGPGLVVHDTDNRWWYDGREIDRESSSSALAVAAVAGVSGPEELVRSMAWGCPTIAPGHVLAATGAEPGVDALAAGGVPLSQQLQEVAADVRLSAALSRAGRARYEAAHSLVRCVDEVLAALRLVTSWVPSAMQTRLHELDSRRGQDQRARFADMVSAVTDGGL